MKILLIEDDDFFRKAYIRQFKRSQYDLITLPGGQKALETFQQETPDLVITDILMPEIDGMMVIDQIRKVDKNVPIIAASGGGKSVLPDLNLAVAKQHGANAIIEKPFTHEALMTLIEELIK